MAERPNTPDEFYANLKVGDLVSKLEENGRLMEVTPITKITATQIVILTDDRYQRKDGIQVGSSKRFFSRRIVQPSEADLIWHQGRIDAGYIKNRCQDYGRLIETTTEDQRARIAAILKEPRQ